MTKLISQLENVATQNAEYAEMGRDFPTFGIGALGTQLEEALRLARIASLPGYTLRDRPLTLGEIRKQQKLNGTVSGVYRVELGDMTQELESLLDFLSETLTETGLLENHSYTVVGFDKGNTLHLKISGDARLILEDADERTAE